ncbi:MULTISPECIES: Hsp20 family protein [Rhizobium/Agrobacterium group]|uniref:Hsp20 family protein n=1 Tax=Rhizobium/Agrobacterium group TaxID=227290 RepID=UPI000B3FC1D8|nr:MULTISPECIES: Hsp20 family protein [Rhizobium/Agrobacterium group]MCF1483313.1 Hsp20 family protein [Allorhizobium ampelinum]MVA71190.1 Hsp20 family protein [Agrobacterium vitis]NSZ15500.1 Hsp20 family protein [Agrobacterium vitis]NSZ41496.1 Hsp20 family protein [Agrobacterium vitis]NTA25179.1 Hsp20 family protein [Allorhizobium ampelinum]
MRRTKSITTPLLLGFDITDAVLSQLARTSDGYPPYNIELVRRTSDHEGDRLRITLAVAGFSESDLEVLVEGNQLIIRGSQNERPDADYLFRGIAARNFQRSFLLTDGMDVSRARMRNGLLVVELIRPDTQQMVRKINISASD